MRLKPLALALSLLTAGFAASNAHALAVPAGKVTPMPAALSLDLTPTVITDTMTNLKLQWTWNLATATSSLDFFSTPQLKYWDVDLSAATQVVSVPLIGSFSLLTAGINAQHVVAPHSGDAPTGNAFSYVWAESNTPAFTTAYSETLGHPGAHSDLYTFESTRSGAGDVTFTLTAVHAVPEPETYAMLLAGLGLIGAAARRRRAR
ncbi:PEPxxWA-CTERM sorting domain-containing protein [Niveibacterium sp. 24ML]|uniref:PEPxxWA-CTERM sorting domain-containing protein n=1 Tax=Niveibacterium sp. 24ML TaxID=2985512 RepID=UPI0022709843|nr:PEPxxWA-CTERM sorting domain-containing protein [Niveibacterium sp. 24ML]MCX9155693.1 PEPxxWA-CTERM sorting domain-containing protein [Niveibacterium sp. 24ML]